MPEPTSAQRALIAQQARKLMAHHMAKARSSCALKHNTPPATESMYEPGELILV